MVISGHLITLTLNINALSNPKRSLQTDYEIKRSGGKTLSVKKKKSPLYGITCSTNTCESNVHILLVLYLCIFACLWVQEGLIHKLQGRLPNMKANNKWESSVTLLLLFCQRDWSQRHITHFDIWNLSQSWWKYRNRKSKQRGREEKWLKSDNE